MNKVFCDVEEKLRSKEHKLTSRRKHVLSVLLENRGKHLSAEEVYNLVKVKAPDVGLATVYRTLELFCDFGVVHGMDFGDGRKRYEFGDEEAEGHQHHHVICLKCGVILEVAEDLLEDLEERVERDFGFSVQNHQLKIFGYCKDCKGK
ncbi:MAG: Fur family transcriptional regulator [Bacillota bacterium]